MKKIIAILSVLLCTSAFADDDTPQSPRISLFSTTVDWEAVTGLSLAQYRGHFIGDAVGPLRLVCIYPPREIKFAYRNAPQDAEQAESTGLLTCPVSGDYELHIDLSKCERGPDWKKFQR